MKPLTAEEIARTRYLVSQIESDPDSSIIGRLLDEVERSRALLKRIEWSGTGGEWSDVKGCPECKADVSERRGHESGCELAALIGDVSVRRES